MRVVCYEGNLAAQIPEGHFYHDIMRSLPKRRFLPAQKLWVFPPWLGVMTWVRDNLPALSWDREAEARFVAEFQAERYRQDVAAGRVDFSEQLSGIPFRLPPYEHQRRALVMGRDQKVFAYLMDQGCVDCDTEYLSPTGWVRIADYRGGPVAQTDIFGNAAFVEPTRFVKLPCERMIHFRTTYGLDQMLSPEHRMIVERFTGEREVREAAEVARRFRSGRHQKWGLPASFRLAAAGPGTGLTEGQLRLQVAVCADGTFPNDTVNRRAYIKIKKPRKIARLRALAPDWVERPVSDDGFIVFAGEAPIRTKTLALWNASIDELRVIADEVLHWDGTESRNSFYTRDRETADFVSYAFAATGHLTRVTKSGPDYLVRYRAARFRLHLGGDPGNVRDVPSPDGFKYCFEVPSTFLVFRRNGCVFISGNTGKTKVILDDAAHNFREGRIDGLLVVSPNSVKTNWVNTATDDDEVEKHLAPDIPFAKAAYFASPTADQRADFDAFWRQINRRDRLLILSLNVEGIWTKKAEALAESFLRKRGCMIVVDESTRIGNRSSRRTRTLLDLRKLAPMARIASGTPIIKSPLKAYSQFGFLDPNILGAATFTEFQARYAVMQKMKGAPVEVPVRYVNTEELADKIAGVSFRVTKEQCLDLPPKVYQKRMIYMGKEQQYWYDKMKKDSLVWLTRDHKVEAVTVLTQLLRLQQITAGYLPLIDEGTGEQVGVAKIGEGAPAKVQEAMDIIEETEGKAIVWCKFKFEIEEMRDACRRAGVEAVTFYGETSEADRAAARARFQDDPALRVFIGQVRTGGIGITLHAASTVIYLSNTFSTEDRVQSEDRAHRIGQTKSVNYYDLVVPKTVDVKIMGVLRENKRVSDEVMRDGFRAWI